MDASKLQPILNKESILKTANAKELEQDPHAVLQRYQNYSLTHVPLGDTTRQLQNLERVVTMNQKCAVGTIVGPYGYGKTSTAVHLWNELRERHILSVPPFQWVNLQQLVDAVYAWVRFEFQGGPAKFVEPLDKIYERYAAKGFERVTDSIDREAAQELLDKGLLNLEMRPDDVVAFYSEASELALNAGYQGLAVFTDELQVTVAEYKPSRDQFFNDLFQIVKETIDRAGKWVLIISMDDGTEGIIAQMRNDLLQRMQRSALYFRVKDVYSRRQYPAELWAAFATRFGFDGDEVVLPETLQSIGEIATRDDLGAGPRMVTNALSLAVKQYDESQTAYTPLQFVDDFLSGQVQFDQRGKFVTAVNKALDNTDVRNSEANRSVVRLLAAFPAGCPEAMLERFDLLNSFNDFPPLARNELFFLQSEGYTLRYLLEEERAPEAIEQRLTQEFVRRYSPGSGYAEMAARGFMNRVLLAETFGTGWKPNSRISEQKEGKTLVLSQQLTGTFDSRYPERDINLVVTAPPRSVAPTWQKRNPDVQIEICFELNFNLPEMEPSRLLVSPERPDMAIFQLNLQAIDKDAAPNILPELLFKYYDAEKLSPLLTLALLDYLYANSGDLPDDINRVRAVGNQLRQFALTLLLGNSLQGEQEEFASKMVGHERVRDLFKAQCRRLYPHYETLVTGNKWRDDLQFYRYAIDKVVTTDGVAVVRGRRPWETTKSAAADAFTIPGRSLSRLETLLDSLGKLIVKEEYSGRSPESPIRLRFKSHPLERQWLEQLEMSKGRGKVDGKEGPALYVIELMRQARGMGYLAGEIEQVLQLLTSRKYVGMDQRKGLLVRLTEETDELREEIESRLNRIDEEINRLKEATVDFEPERYPMGELRRRLAESADRDELEMLRSEVARAHGGIQKYAAGRAGWLRDEYERNLDDLRQQLQEGVPTWLQQPFAASPLQDLLEQQRKNYIEAYGTVLAEARQLYRDGNAMLQTVPEPPIDVIETLQKELPELKRSREKLETKRTGIGDLKDDFIAWHAMIKTVVEFEAKMRISGERYGTQEWDTAMSQIWGEIHKAIETNPLSLSSLLKRFRQQVNVLAKKFNEWLQNRREDFEKQRESYERALAQMEIQPRLRIPYDEANPVESYNALVETVNHRLHDAMAEWQRQLNQVLQQVRYAGQVQHADLGETVAAIERLLTRLDDLRNRLTPDMLRDLKAAQRGLFDPLQEIRLEAAAVAADVEQAMRKRAPVGREEVLLQSMQALANGNEVDLYSLIVHQLEHADETFDLERLMDDLQGLFQKNQIGLRVRFM